MVELRQTNLEKIPSVAQSSSAPEISSDPLDGYSVLIADDSRDMLYLLNHHLQKSGAYVAQATNERDVFKLTKKQPFHAVIVGGALLRSSSQPIVKKLRRFNYCGPVIALSTHERSGDKQRYFAAGFATYLIKPIRGARLVEALRKIRHQHQPTAQKRPSRDTPSLTFKMPDSIDLL